VGFAAQLIRGIESRNGVARIGLSGDFDLAAVPVLEVI
jgi:hypothetical protein